MAIQKVTVVGAGNMGAGIAQSFAQGGLSVQLHDVRSEFIDAGLERVRGPLQKRVESGKMKPEQLATIMDNLHPAPDFAEAVRGADLVVEAVFEDLEVKRDLFRRLHETCDEATILATNTSSLYVKELAAATGRPDRVVGLHYFFPAQINKLVEVVRGPETSDETFDEARAAVGSCGKIPIETADAPGFCVNRFFVPWVNESCRLLDEGVADIPTIEAAAKEAFGISMGPFRLMNVTGVPISLHAQRTLHRELGAFYEPSQALVAKVEEGEDWVLDGDPDASRFDAVASRLRGVVFGIVCHLVEAGVADHRDTDKGATVGLRWANGPFTMMNQSGLEEALGDVQAIHDAWGDDFPLPKSLVEHASSSAPWPVPAAVLDWLDDGLVARITFDRPAALNALSPAVLADVEAALDEIEDAGTARALIVTGTGKAFAAGADIKAMAAMDEAGARAYTQQGERVMDRMRALEAPVIMAINGLALGGGLELALGGDLLYAAEGARLGLPEVGLGIHPGFGGTQRLPRRVGIGPARELIFTGRTIDAAEAHRIGLVNGVVPADELAAHCLKVARTIAGKAPLAVAGAKRAIDEGAGTTLANGLAAEKESVVLLFASQDKREGLQAFLEGRRPRFQGR